MAYYNYVQMDSLQPEEIIILENIYMLLNGRWHYKEAEETKKMKEMFENSEDVIAKIMSIKEIDVRNRRASIFLPLTEEEKKLGMIDDPEKWIVEIDNQRKSSFTSYLDATSVEMLKALAKFYLKIAVYRFCTVHWPKLACLDKINKKSTETFQKELEHWEISFWIDTSLDRDKTNIEERRRLISGYVNSYYAGYNGHTSLVRGWIEEIYKYKDKVYYENAKKLRLKYIDKISKRDDRSGKKIAEIESMRNLLDIIEKHLCDDLTPQNIADFKANMKDWEKDIEKLSALFNNLPALDLKMEVPLKAD